MLKTILGHWKAHRRKPSLLPEEGDVHFEEPSRVNPLFEDSDSSSSLTKTHSFIYEQKPNKTEESEVNELVDVSVPATSNETIQSELTTLNDEIADPRNVSVLINSEITSETKNFKDDSLLNLEQDEVSKSSLNNTSNEETLHDIYPKHKADESSNKIEEEFQILNQPSTSAILEERTTFVDSVDDENKDASQTLTPVSEQIKEVHQENNDRIPLTMKTEYLEDELNVSEITPSKSNISSLIDTEQQENKLDKPEKLKARAIDELIKKFQGPSTENDNVIDKIKGKKNYSSKRSTEHNKILNKITKNEQSNAFATTKPILSEASNKSSPEKEALSNIFSFPPPPPLEQLKNESSLHGRILTKATKPISPLKAVTTQNADKIENPRQSKTRSDSSLEKTKTVSSNKQNIIPEKTESNDQNETAIKHKETYQNKSFLHSSICRNSQIKKSQQVGKNEESKTLNNSEQSSDARKNKYHDSKFETSKQTETETTTNESNPHTSKDSISVKKPTQENTKSNEPEIKLSESKFQISNDSIVIKNVPTLVNTKKSEPILNHDEPQDLIAENSVSNKAGLFNHEPTVEASTSYLTKSISESPHKLESPEQKQKSSSPKSFPKLNLSKENENMKSHSEDSGITRGDQISSEATQDVSANNPSEVVNPVSNPSRKSKREKKSKQSNKKNSKSSKGSHDNVSIKRGQCDDYYDILTGMKHFHRSKHSDSWTSDLSWEEKELLRRLRSRRGTVRSNAPSTKSRRSRHRYMGENYFKCPYPFHHSISDESNFCGSSLCSCDECWAHYVKGYAYARASLRGMPPIQEMCTCRSSRNNFLGRRVQFQPDIIAETSPSEKTTRTTTPAPKTDNQQEDDTTDDKSSQRSSKTKDSDSVNQHPNGVKEKKLKFSDEAYRIMTPWELEEIDFYMKKQLLKKRRKRARYMGIMALAMVIFVGLIVAILMVYLRRKVL